MAEMCCIVAGDKMILILIVCIDPICWYEYGMVRQKSDFYIDIF